MPCARRSRYNSLRCAHLFLSEVTDVSFVPRKLIAHRHFVQRTPTRSMRQVRLSISHPAQCEHRGWLVKYRYYAQMYGPPPNCKRFEVDEGQSA
jgi:hypothetical protein